VTRLTILLALVLILITSACGNLGLGEADCSAPVDDISSSTIMTVQAVPGAKYTPCLNELRLGWDSINWFAESGRAGIKIEKSFDAFLTATVTEACDVSDATPVESDHPDIERFDDIDFEPTEIEVVIVPSGEKPLADARRLVNELAGVEIDDRPVRYTITTAVEDSVGSRVDTALTQADYVWIIDEVDVEEGTVQLRSNDSDASGRGLQPQAALDLIEDVAPDVFYSGNWYFTFEGGCITYEFDAKGLLAETVAEDAADALGFYPAFELRQFARDAGFDIG
jgi:hypothetical protein